MLLHTSIIVQHTLRQISHHLGPVCMCVSVCVGVCTCYLLRKSMLQVPKILIKICRYRFKHFRTFNFLLHLPSISNFWKFTSLVVFRKWQQIVQPLLPSNRKSYIGSLHVSIEVFDNLTANIRQIITDGETLQFPSNRDIYV